MALSGSFYTNVGSNWRLKLDWSATQDVAGNSSTVTAKLYWMGLNQYGTTYSTATKDGSVTINGSSSTFSGGSLAKLSGAETKLIKQYSVVVPHNSDGTKTVALSAFFDVELTLGGTYFGRVNVSGSAVLNTIARASSLASGQNWTAGDDSTLVVSRALSSFTHDIAIHVLNQSGAYVGIKTVYGVATSASTAFSLAENKLIFTTLAGGDSAKTKITITTKSGSTVIGTTIYYGVVSTNNRSTTSFGSGEFYIGDTLQGSITTYDSRYKHILELEFGGTRYKIADMVAGGDWSYNTSLIATELYSKIPTATSITGGIFITTYYEGIQVRGFATSPITAMVRTTATNPTFDGGFTYADIDTTTKAITGNALMIIQNKSNVRVTLPVAKKAVATNGATMVNYIATLNGKQVVKPYSSTADVVFDFGTITAGVDVTLSVKAIDSRNGITERTMTVTVVPYLAPTLVRSAKRVNNFESSTVVTLSGSLSPLTVGGIQKNAIAQIKYRTKLKSSSTWGGYVNFAYSASGAQFSATNVTLNLDNTQAYDIEVYVADKLSYTSFVLSVSSGKPVMFIDSKKKSVGVNKFPTGSGTFEVEGNMSVSGVTYADGNLVTPEATIAGKATIGNIDTTVAVVGSRLRLASSGSDSYIQAGYSGSDTEATLRITRMLTTGSPLKRIVAFADSMYLSGSFENESTILMSLVNGFKNYSLAGGAYSQAGYWKDKNGVVHLTGFIQSGTNSTGTAIATLPVGYRPLQSEVFSCFTNDAPNGFTMRLNIDGTGAIALGSPYTTWISLAGISFRAE